MLGLWCAVGVLLLCSSSLAAPKDTKPPSIAHQPVTVAPPVGNVLDVEAVISDPAGVFEPTLLVRSVGATEYTRVPMKPVAGTVDLYRATLAAGLLSTAPLEYFIEAFDNDGNGPTSAGSESSPLRIEAARASPVVVAPPTPTAPVVQPAPDDSGPWPVVIGVVGAVVGAAVLGGGGVAAFYLLRPAVPPATTLQVSGPAPLASIMTMAAP
jgi:hypothetical protein